MQWIRPTLNDGIAGRLAKELSINPVAAALLVSRGIEDPESARLFLSPRLDSLNDPLQVGGMPDAVDLLEQALIHQQSILIFGDYDVDGVTSTVMLTQFLRHFGMNPRYIVPNRLEEGYGLSMDSLERALSDGRPDLLIAVDCGTSSHAEIAWLVDQGIKVMILDHHTSKESLPEKCVMVNPHVMDPDDVPWKNLCSAGLVFKFCHAFLKIMRSKGDSLAEQTDLREFLDLVALGTVADLVRLEGENRILVKHGLKRLQKCHRPGVCALMEVSGISLGDEVGPFDIGFKIGPRINASGRLSDASLPIQLLLNEDWTSCHEAAKLLDSYNRERQEIEREITEQAELQVENQYSENMGLVLQSPDWHSGVVGIVASRISRRFHRPTLVLGADSDGQLKGSGRSVNGVDLVDALKSCEDHIVRWGGHPMAVGLSVEIDSVDELRTAFNLSLSRMYPEGLPEPTLRIDAEILPQELDEDLLQDLDCLAPYGQGNEEPLFSIREAQLQNISLLGKEHFKFQLVRPGANYPMDGVAWGMGERIPPVDRPVQIAVRFHWHTWRGRKNQRLTLLDWK